mgnify:CR=1 FL=1|jgi:hypothetical protein|tara:strand:+ start:382 stop:618 length:237 start_codon:yes stop_codon:yes gene_type:complete
MLKDKNKIENYEEKAKFLNENGYETWYHDDNWVHKSSFKSPYGPDRAGNSTDGVYCALIQRQKDIEHARNQKPEDLFI